MFFFPPGVFEASTRRSARDGPRRCDAASGRWWAPRSCRALRKVMQVDGPQNPVFTNWGWSTVLFFYIPFWSNYIPGGDRQISEPSTVGHEHQDYCSEFFFDLLRPHNIKINDLWLVIDPWWMIDPIDLILFYGKKQVLSWRQIWPEFFGFGLKRSKHKSHQITMDPLLECWTWPCIQHVQRTYSERR